MKQALILGATSDMGQAFARRCAAEGFGLTLAARNTDVLGLLANDLRVRFNTEIETVLFDALDMAGHPTFYKNLKHRPDVAACFVGWLGDADAVHKDFTAARQVLDTNYTGVVSILDRVAEEFEARGKGIIIGVSSVAGDRGRQPGYHYGSSKAALTAYLSGLRNRLYASGVHVITVKPGYCHTKMVEHFDLPAAITSDPEQVAHAIYKAMKRKQNVVYVLWMWRWIMLAIQHIPEALFKRLRM